MQAIRKRIVSLPFLNDFAGELHRYFPVFFLFFIAMRIGKVPFMEFHAGINESDKPFPAFFGYFVINRIIKPVFQVLSFK